MWQQLKHLVRQLFDPQARRSRRRPKTGTTFLPRQFPGSPQKSSRPAQDRWPHKHTGLEAQNRAGHDDFMAHLVGLIAHVHNVNAEQGQRLLDQVTRRSEGT
jgi:hypothetical protein